MAAPSAPAPAPFRAHAPPAGAAALGVRGRPLAHRATDALALALLQPTIPEHEIRRHLHDDAHVVVLLAGRYVSDAAGMPEVCAEPAVIFNPPGTEHRDRFRSRDGRFLTVAMPGGAYARLCDGAAPAARAIRLPHASLSRAFGLLREIDDWDEASSLAVESVFADWLADAGTPSPASPDGRLQRVRERLDDASAQPPTLRELAGIAGLHPVYLARAFRRRHGVAPSDYLRMRRLHRAVSLLAAKRTLTDAAALLGFTDASHLHRSFVAEFGLTPGEFRRLALGRGEVSRIQDRRLRRC
jgi:AraC family transcriptional regulator